MWLKRDSAQNAKLTKMKAAPKDCVENVHQRMDLRPAANVINFLNQRLKVRVYVESVESIIRRAGTSAHGANLD